VFYAVVARLCDQDRPVAAPRLTPRDGAEQHP
jgi:hypothetical protein